MTPKKPSERPAITCIWGVEKLVEAFFLKKNLANCPIIKRNEISKDP